MKVLVAFYSETGNTEEVATAIYEEASREHEAHLKEIIEVTAEIFNDYDLIFLGSPCHSTDLAAPVKRILDTLPKSPNFKLAGFFTHATVAVGELFDRWASKCILSLEEASKERQIDFRGYYNCQGVPSPPIQEFIKKEILVSADEWKEYMEEVRKHPNPEDLQKAKEFAREVLSKT